jgi:hypothetical protein
VRVHAQGGGYLFSVYSTIIFSNCPLGWGGYRPLRTIPSLPVLLHDSWGHFRQLPPLDILGGYEEGELHCASTGLYTPRA